MNTRNSFICVILFSLQQLINVRSQDAKTSENGHDTSRKFADSFQIVSNKSQSKSEIFTSLDVTNTIEDLSSQSGRLPLSIKPYHYTIKLQPFINGNRSIIGEISIAFGVISETERIILNMIDIITHNDSCKVVATDGTAFTLNILQQSYNPELQFYTIHLDSILESGRNYSLSLSFQGYLNSKLVGFYFSSYKDATGKERSLASTQFSPTDARRAFPCFDEPGFKATFDISLVREGNMTSLSNMPMINTEKLLSQEGWFVDHFKTTPKMSTYLVGFLISDFIAKPSTFLSHTQFRVLSREEAINQTSYALEVGPKLLLYLENYFGIDFPLPKLDMAAIPNFKFNGMENWGLIMYRESAMLFDPLVSTVRSKRSIMAVIAHEIAHMWFGNLVTPEWWSELWLKEGFANFMGYKAVDGVDPSWNMVDYLVDTSYYSAFTLDCLKSSHPINVNVDRADRISEIFDDISYSKGASIIRMMQHFLTEPVFKKGMTSYLQTLKYGNAVQSDLWKFLTEAWKQSKYYNPNITVGKVMDTWTLQDGFPVLTIARNGSRVSAKQMRFLLDNEPVVSNATALRKWWIPVSFTKESSPDFDVTEPRVWMSPQEDEVVISEVLSPSEWFILNVQKTGFFKVNYDNVTWFMLMNQLLTNPSVIHHLNRAQLIDDSFSLSRAGMLTYSIPISLVKYMKTERDYTAWSTFVKHFRDIYYNAKFTQKLHLFQDFILDLVTPLYNETGFVDSSKDDYETQSLRILATDWSCKAEYEPCIKNAISLFNIWLALPSNESALIISSNVKPTVLCTGIKFSSVEKWNKTFQAYLNSNVQTEKADILTALGCINDSVVLQRYLEMSIDPASGIIKQDSSYVFQAVSKQGIGRDLAWKLIKERWNFIVEYFGSGSNALGRILQSPAKKFNTRELVEELKAFGEKNKDNMASAQQALKLSIETSQLNVRWMVDSLPQIINELQKMKE